MLGDPDLKAFPLSLTITFPLIIWFFFSTMIRLRQRFHYGLRIMHWLLY